MARISTYALDTTIDPSDKLLGTDVPGNLVTKNYAISDLKTFCCGTSVENYIPIWNATGNFSASAIYQDTWNGPSTIYLGQKAEFINGIYLKGPVQDYAGAVGAAEQVLVSQADGQVKWENYQGSGLEYQTAWNATTNTPTLGAADLIAANTGKYWICSTPGSTSLSGITDWKAGDWAIISEDSAGVIFWDKIDNSSALTGSGTANYLPIWTNTEVLGDSPIYVRVGTSDNVVIEGGNAPTEYEFGNNSFSAPAFDFKSNGLDHGHYDGTFRFASKIGIDRSSNIGGGASLDVGQSNNNYPAARFYNGVIISNNPGGIQVDNTSLVVGAGNNDIITGSDHSAIFGQGNQLTNTAANLGSDSSVAIGSGNTMTDAKNSLTVGSQNTLIGTGMGTDANGLRTQILGLNNSVTNTYASIILGGQNTINTTGSGLGQNTFVLGYSNNIQGQADNIYAIGSQCAYNFNQGQSYMIGTDIDGTPNCVSIGSYNNTSNHPTPNPTQGLGSVGFTVGTGNNNGNKHSSFIITKHTGSGNNPGSRIIMKDLVNFNFADDATAGAAGIPVGGLYHTAGVVKIRLT